MDRGLTRISDGNPIPGSQARDGELTPNAGSQARDGELTPNAVIYAVTVVGLVTTQVISDAIPQGKPNPKRLSRTAACAKGSMLSRSLDDA